MYGEINHARLLNIYLVDDTIQVIVTLLSRISQSPDMIGYAEYHNKYSIDICIYYMHIIYNTFIFTECMLRTCIKYECNLHHMYGMHILLYTHKYEGILKYLEERYRYLCWIYIHINIRYETYDYLYYVLPSYVHIYINNFVILLVYLRRYIFIPSTFLLF